MCDDSVKHNILLFSLRIEDLYEKIIHEASGEFFNCSDIIPDINLVLVITCLSSTNEIPVNVTFTFTFFFIHYKHWKTKMKLTIFSFIILTVSAIPCILN